MLITLRKTLGNYNKVIIMNLHSLSSNVFNYNKRRWDSNRILLWLITELQILKVKSAMNEILAVTGSYSHEIHLKVANTSK